MKKGNYVVSLIDQKSSWGECPISKGAITIIQTRFGVKYVYFDHKVRGYYLVKNFRLATELEKDAFRNGIINIHHKNKLLK